MSRPLRIAFAHAVYHVTSRGNARQAIVADDDDRRTFLAILAHVVTRYGWLCHAYCLMDNHYHLLIETPTPNLSLGMRQLNGLYTKPIIAGIAASAICCKGASRRSWWRKTRICWNCVDTWC